MADSTVAENMQKLNISDDTTQQVPEADGTPASGRASLTASTDNPEFSIKHPLQNKWVWWFDYPGKKTNSNTWASFLKEIYAFDTVEDFWCLHNHITPVVNIQAGSNYHVFKEGIQPMWEDKANERGGKWTVEFSSKLRMKQLDQLWLFAILALIGETFGDDGDQICGVVVSVRKQNDRIALWTKDSRNQDAIMRIGHKFKEALQLPANQVIGYQPHNESANRNSSHSNKPRYQV